MRYLAAFVILPFPGYGIPDLHNQKPAIEPSRGSEVHQLQAASLQSCDDIHDGL